MAKRAPKQPVKKEGVQKQHSKAAPALSSRDVSINEQRKALREERRATWERPSMFELASLVAASSGTKLAGQDYLETVRNVLQMWEHCGVALREIIDARNEYLRLDAQDVAEELKGTFGPFPVEFEEALRQIFEKRRKPERYRLLREFLRDTEAWRIPSLIGELSRANPTDLSLFSQRDAELRRMRESEEVDSACDKRFAELKETGFPRNTYFQLTEWFIEFQDRLQRNKASKGGKALREKRAAQKKLQNSLAPT